MADDQGLGRALTHDPKEDIAKSSARLYSPLQGLFWKYV